MKVKCNYCDNYFDDNLDVCPVCGAPNDYVNRSSIEQPKTIEELKLWYKQHNLPPENVTRFFIGKNIKERRAFGIYQDENTGNFVVYKNKDNGQRAIRYDGKDEKYAVNELYQRLRAEISNQKSNNKGRNQTVINPKMIVLISFITVFVIFAFTLFVVILSQLGPDRGYYTYNDNTYYYQHGDWYYYDDTYDTWYETSVDSDLKSNYDSYYDSKYYSSDYGVSDFSDSKYYTDDSDYGSDWDNDSSWSSSDSWDSGGSDWGSDW